MFHINLIDIQSYTTTQIVEGIITSGDKMMLDVTFSVIGSTLYSYEVALEHLAVAFFLERITLFCNIKDVERKTDGFSRYTRYTLAITEDKCSFAEHLIHYGTWFIDGVLMHEINDEFGEFQCNIDNYKTNYADSIEKAYANFVTRGIYELAAEAEEDDNVYLEKHYFRRHPEWKHGYWKHHQKGILSDSLYYSPYNWVIKSDDRDAIFMAVYGCTTKFEKCWTVDEISFCKYGAVVPHIPNVHQAILLLSEINANLNFNKAHYYLSENNDILIADYGEYSIVSFEIVYAKEQTLKKCYSELSEQAHNLASLLGYNEKYKIDWSRCTPESFEDLCYEIIRILFAHKDVEIHRMGNSRSRDGGRDIVIYEQLAFSDKEKVYIVQCKLITNGKSLSKGRVGSIADVVIQYNADAYIVMTNEVIDSTLHDLLDSLKANKLHTDTSIRFDKNRIEHFLALHKEIRDKYI